MLLKRPGTETVSRSSLFFPHVYLFTYSLKVQKNFVFTVRAVEVALGIPIPGVTSDGSRQFQSRNASDTIIQVASDPSVGAEVGRALLDAAPILLQVIQQLGISVGVEQGAGREALFTK